MLAGEAHESPTRLSPGEIVAGRYRVDELIGRGGMGEIYRAEHLLTGQHVALKLVRRSSDEAQRRLLREAKAASRLKSPHTARVLDADTMASGDPFLVFELLQGQDLGSVLRARGRLSASDAIACIVQAASALAEAHALGIVHRDVKPSNLFLVATEGRVEIKVLDFGIAKVDVGADSNVTITGSVIGSPRYMSPEQIRDPKRTDARTDVWSLGVTLHELLTGYAPFEESYAPALCAMITSEAPQLRLAATTDASTRLVAIIERCLAKDRRERFASAADLGEALRAVELDESETSVSLRPASAPSTSDDTLEPQDTSNRGGAGPPVSAPVENRARSRAVVLSTAALATLAAALWWTQRPSPTREPGTAAIGVEASESRHMQAPVEPARSAPEPVAVEPETAAALSVAAPSPSAVPPMPRPAAPTPKLRSSTSAPEAPAPSAAPVLDESTVLKDRR